MKIKYLISIFMQFSLILIIGCNGGEMSEKNYQLARIEDVPAANWEKLAQKKIYFGHQSVGYNIFQGINDLMKENPKIKLNIVKTSDESDFRGGIFAHSGVGKNGFPKSKIDSFAQFVEKGIGKNADIAFFKFCYVDIRTDTEVKDVFSHYKKTMLELEKSYPDTQFVHVTVPLTTELTAFQVFSKKVKIIIGKFTGKPAWFLPKGNQQRNMFNEMLIQEYDGKAPIFDLAKFESTYHNGTRCSFKNDGKTYYCMVPEYTEDGGHLNETSRKKIAEQLLIFLASHI